MSLSIYRPIHLICRCILFRVKPKIYTSFFASEDDYDYLFYRETLLNSDESTSINMTGKDTLRFQDPIQIYTHSSCSCVGASLGTKSCARIKWDCHCLITWYFYYWWSFHWTSKRQI